MTSAKFEAAIVAMNKVRRESGVNYSGKLYSMVKDRVELFRREWGDEYGINTEVDYSEGFEEGAPVVAIAKITRDGNVLASGHAMVFVGSDDFTANSPIEVAETSAIGRALACFGLHGGEYASGNEVETKRGPDPQDSRERQGLSASQTGRPINGPQANGNSLNERVQREPPKPQPSGLYAPDGTGEWEPEADQQRVLAVIESIRTTGDLGRYWNELKPFMAALGKNNPDLTSEIKAAFATANNSLGGK